MTTAGYDGSIKIDTSIDSKGFDKGVANLGGGFGNIAKIAAVAFTAITAAIGVAALAAFNFGKDAVAASSATSSATIGLRSVVEGMGLSFEKAKGFLKSYVSDGLVPATNAMMAYKNLASRGYNSQQIEQTLNALKNSAAFSRQGSLTMGQAIQGATEGLKNENSILVDNAGVTKNVSIMWKEYAASIGTTVNSLTKQQKIEAEVQGIMQETRFQMGDAAKLSGTYSGKVAALETSFYNLKVAVGNSITPILSAMIPVIKQVVDWLVILFNQFAQVMEFLFGADISSGDMSENLSAAAGSAGELAQNTTEAGKAAKGALASFDQLNVLQTDSGAGSGGSGAGAPSGSAPVIPMPDGGAMDDALTQMAAWKVALLDLLRPVSEAFARLQDALRPLGKTLFSGLKWAWDNILVPLGKWTLKTALPTFLNLITAGAKALNAVLIALRPVGQWLWDQFLKPLADFAGAAIIAYIKDITNGFEQFSQWVTKNPLLFANLVKGFIQLIAPITQIPGLIEEVKKEISQLVTMYVDLFTKISTQAKIDYDKIILQWGQMAVWFDKNVTTPVKNYFINLWTNTVSTATTAWTNIKTAWGQAVNWFNVVVINPIKAYFTSTWANISTNASNAWTNIQNAWTNAKNWFKVNFIDTTALAFTTFWANITTAGGNAWANIKNLWSNAVSWFDDTTRSIKGLFSSAWDSVLSGAQSMWNTVSGLFQLGWNWVDANITQPLRAAFDNALAGIEAVFTSAFDAIKNGIKGSMNGLIGLLNNMLDNATDGINGLINGVNAIGAWIPGWSNFPTINAPNIPYLATGAVIPPNAQFAAILGDQTAGVNLEGPESMFRKIVREEGGGGKDITVTLKADDGDNILRALVQMMYAEIKVEENRIGKSYVLGGEPR